MLDWADLDFHLFIQVANEYEFMNILLSKKHTFKWNLSVSTEWLFSRPM